MAKKKEDGSIVTSNEVLSSFLKSNKEDHYNFEDDFDFKVSSGSLQLDIQLGGGFGPGLHRFCGINEGGKTSAALEVMKNFLRTVPNAKGFYIKAEGRLSNEMKERSGVPFTTKAEDWNVGTCFVFESNIYETVVDAMRNLVANNEENIKYYFLLDAVDGLITKGDLDKTFEDSNKVAGGAVIAANFMKRMSIALAKRGHIAVFISQVRADIKLDPYSKAPIRQTSATGGNALLHFANWILEFEPRFNGDLILQDPNNKRIDLEKNPAIGH
jgi:RecA/RadA recombinase